MSSSRTPLKGSSPQMHRLIVELALGKASGGQLTNFAKLNRKAAFSSYSPEGLACAWVTGDALNMAISTSITAMICLGARRFLIGEMPNRTPPKLCRALFKQSTDLGS